MATNTSYILVLLVIATTLLSQSSADIPPINPVPPSLICKSTPHPSFCNQVLPIDNSTSNVFDYGRFSIKKSLTTAQNFLSLVEKNIQKSKKLTISAMRALEDCKFLAETNIDYLTTCSQTVDQISQTLTSSEANFGQTLLSAILTNIDTCIDSLQVTILDSSIRNSFLTPLTNDTQLYSVSLALFKQGWVPKNKKTTNHKLIPTIFNGRRLLQVNGSTTPVLISGMVTVNQNGTGNFTTINDALNVAPNNTKESKGYFLIYVMAGVYEEYVTIASNKKYLMMVGDGINQTIVTGNRSVIDGWTTFTSHTFAVTATGFVAMNMTFRNTAGGIKHQAVAVRNGADLSTFYNCSFEGYQDTLYVHSLRQFFRECDIYGTVDFIFGNAAVVFQNCNIYPRLPNSGQFNAITAQGRTDPNQNTGISVHNCTIRAADDLATSNRTVKTYLGRPWKEYSLAVYMQSFMDSLINLDGWSIWSGDFALNTSYYAEFNNSGPGSNTSQRVTWPGFHIINDTDAVNFTVSQFLLGDNWIPKTGVSYTSGLLSV